jgi:hypothetical protein
MHRLGALPHLRQGGQAVVLAEEWHTVNAVLHIDWLLRQAACRPQVTLFWNANNTFGFDRIPWERLAQAATITTVSRYMNHLMWDFGVAPLVIPNGLTTEALRPPARDRVAALRARMRRRTVLSKVARWDPDKRWLLAVETIGILKYQGWRPLLVAAAAAGLRVMERIPEVGILPEKVYAASRTAHDKHVEGFAIFVPEAFTPHKCRRQQEWSGA